jgi:hypothetical protein
MILRQLAAWGGGKFLLSSHFALESLESKQTFKQINSIQIKIFKYNGKNSFVH